MRERLYESALNDVRYVFGRPLPFNAKLAARMESDDPDIKRKAWEEAAASVR